jgi:hypothetical protein
MEPRAAHRDAREGVGEPEVVIVEVGRMAEDVHLEADDASLRGARGKECAWHCMCERGYIERAFHLPSISLTMPASMHPPTHPPTHISTHLREPLENRHDALHPLAAVIRRNNLVILHDDQKLPRRQTGEAVVSAGLAGGGRGGEEGRKMTVSLHTLHSNTPISPLPSFASLLSPLPSSFTSLPSPTTSPTPPSSTSCTLLLNTGTTKPFVRRAISAHSLCSEGLSTLTSISVLTTVHACMHHGVSECARGPGFSQNPEVFSCPPLVLPSPSSSSRPPFSFSPPSSSSREFCAEGGKKSTR